MNTVWLLEQLQEHDLEQVLPLKDVPKFYKFF